MEDVITYENIPEDHLFILHGYTYNVLSIHEWVVMRNNLLSPFRRKVTDNERIDIIAKYSELYGMKNIENNSNVFYSQSDGFIKFADTLTNNDILILRGERFVYVYGTYFNNLTHIYVLGKSSISQHFGEYINLEDIVGYITYKQL